MAGTDEPVLFFDPAHAATQVGAYRRKHLELSVPYGHNIYSVLGHGTAPAINPFDVNRADNRFGERDEFIDFPYVGPGRFVLSRAQWKSGKADERKGQCCTYQTANANQ
jgi:hypothetical protein